MVTWAGGKAEISVPPGKHKVEVKKGGFSVAGDELDVKEGGRSVFKATLVADAHRPGTAAPQDARAPPGADRRAAEWALNLGGKVRVVVMGQEREIAALANLPVAPFQLTGIDIRSRPVGDNSLAQLEGLTNLRSLILWLAGVDDAGLTHVEGLTSLTILSLNGNPRVTDTGLARLAGLTRLDLLDLNATRVTDAGLIHLKGMTKLASLNLMSTPVRGSGLKHLRGLTGLKALNLGYSQAGDEALTHVEGASNLEGLELSGTRVTEAGLAHLKGLDHLSLLGLRGLKIEDAGLAHLHGLRGLRDLDLTDAAVTRAGVAALQKALPACRIKGAPPAGADADRPASPVASAELEALRRQGIPAEALAAAGDGDPERAPAGLVAVLGEARPVHTDCPRSVAFSPDGRWLASGSFDKTVMLRETATGRVRRVLKGHTSYVMAVAFSKDGRTLVSAGDDGTLKLWPVDQEAQPQTLQPKLGPIYAMAVSADGRFLAAGGTSGGVALWKWGRWDAPLAIPLPPVTVAEKVFIHFNGNRGAALAFSPDGGLLAVGREDNTPPAVIRLFHTSDGKPAQTLTGLKRHPLDLAFSRDGKRLAAFIQDDKVAVWDLPSGKPAAEFTPDQFGCVAFSPDGKTLAAGRPWRIEFYDLRSRATERVLWPGHGDIFTMAYSPDGKLFAAGGGPTGSVSVWDTADWKEKYVETGHRHGVVDVAFCRDGRAVLSLGDDSTVREWDLAHPGQNRVVYRPQTPAYALAVSPDGKVVAVTSAQRPLVVWDVARSRERFTVPLQGGRVTFCPDGKTLAVCDPWGPVHLWDVRLGREVYLFPPAGPWPGLAFSTDGRFLATAGDAVKVWDVASGAEVHSFKDTPTWAVTFSPDGKRLATGHHDGTVGLWDLVAGKKQRTLRGHSAPVQSVRFTPDGRTLVSSGPDGTVRVWDPEVERARQVIPLGPPNHRLVIDLDPSGKYLVAGGLSPLVFMLRLPRGDR
jgi:WD40 repeat protein